MCRVQGARCRCRVHLEAVHRVDEGREAAVPPLLNDVRDAEAAARGDHGQQLARAHVAEEARAVGALAQPLRAGQRPERRLRTDDNPPSQMIIPPS